MLKYNSLWAWLVYIYIYYIIAFTLYLIDLPHRIED